MYDDAVFFCMDVAFVWSAIFYRRFYVIEMRLFSPQWVHHIIIFPRNCFVWIFFFIIYFFSIAAVKFLFVGRETDTRWMRASAFDFIDSLLFTQCSTNLKEEEKKVNKILVCKCWSESNRWRSNQLLSHSGHTVPLQNTVAIKQLKMFAVFF